MINIIWFFIIVSSITWPFAIYGFLSFVEAYKRMEQEKKYQEQLDEQFPACHRRHEERVRKEKEFNIKHYGF